MSATSQPRLRPDGEAELSRQHFDMAESMTAARDVDDAINIAVQMVIQEAKSRGATPTDAIMGIGKALGSTLALMGVNNARELLPLMDEIVLDYFRKSRDVLARFGTEGSA